MAPEGSSSTGISGAWLSRAIGAAAASAPDKLPVPVVGSADDPWPLGVFVDVEAPFPPMEFTAVTRWVGVVGAQYVVLYTGSVGENPSDGAARLLYYSVTDASLASTTEPAVPCTSSAFRAKGVVHPRCTWASTSS